MTVALQIVLFYEVDMTVAPLIVLFYDDDMTLILLIFILAGWYDCSSLNFSVLGG